MMTSASSFKIAVALALALSVSACSKKPAASLDAGLGPAGAGGGSLSADAGDAGNLEMASVRVPPGSVKDFQQNVGDRVFFANDQSSLSGEARSTLLKQAAWLKKYRGVTMQVEGHADERGTREYNISLSAKRATAVREFLIAQGVDAARISSIAFGKEKPAAVCDAEQCWSQNRRSVSVITGGDRTS